MKTDIFNKKFIQEVVDKFICQTYVSYSYLISAKQDFNNYVIYDIYFEDIFENFKKEDIDLIVTALMINLPLNGEFMEYIESKEKEYIDYWFSEIQIKKFLIEDIAKIIPNIGVKTNTSKRWHWFLGLLKIIDLYSQFTFSFKEISQIDYLEKINYGNEDEELFRLVPHEKVE